MSSSGEEDETGPSVDSLDPEERIQARRERIKRRTEAVKRFVFNWKKLYFELLLKFTNNC